MYWYSCHRSRNVSVFQLERIISAEISKGCNFAVAPKGVYHNTQVYSYVPNENQKESTHYWLGILNSKILWWFLTQTGTVLRGGYKQSATLLSKDYAAAGFSAASGSPLWPLLARSRNFARLAGGVCQ